MFCKSIFLENFTIYTRKSMHRSFFLNKVEDYNSASLIKETPAQMFLCEFSEIFQKPFYGTHLNDYFSVYLSFFIFFTEYHKCLAVLFPYHFPKVFNGAFYWGLSSDKTVFELIAVNIICIDVVASLDPWIFF